MGYQLPIKPWLSSFYNRKKAFLVKHYTCILSHAYFYLSFFPLLSLNTFRFQIMSFELFWTKQNRNVFAAICCSFKCHILTYERDRRRAPYLSHSFHLRQPGVLPKHWVRRGKFRKSCLLQCWPSTESLRSLLPFLEYTRHNE